MNERSISSKNQTPIDVTDADKARADSFNRFMYIKLSRYELHQLAVEFAHYRQGHETTAGATDWERARDVVAEVVRGLGGEARIGATLALQAISEAMIGTPASPEKASVSPSPLAQAVMDQVDGTNLGLFITSAVDHIDNGGNVASAEMTLASGIRVEVKLTRASAVNGCETP